MGRNSGSNGSVASQKLSTQETACSTRLVTFPVFETGAVQLIQFHSAIDQAVLGGNELGKIMAVASFTKNSVHTGYPAPAKIPAVTGQL
ncbi:MAG: hypothetical protein A4E57_03142 [Syntrophorhabdaceae bacterium PtaU1.Bin034]|nr:MAG: hypothetical protein A4E57_03142 [Syntrophorhabdaceae bacterium PtaU1.Bin034]